MDVPDDIRQMVEDLCVEFHREPTWPALRKGLEAAIMAERERKNHAAPTVDATETVFAWAWTLFGNGSMWQRRLTFTKDDPFAFEVSVSPAGFTSIAVPLYAHPAAAPTVTAERDEARNALEFTKAIFTAECRLTQNAVTRALAAERERDEARAAEKASYERAEYAEAIARSLETGETFNWRTRAETAESALAASGREIARLREALELIANEDYEPIEDSFTTAAAAIARAALQIDAATRKEDNA